MARLFDDASSQYLEHSGAVLTNYPLSMACWFRSDSTTLSQSLMAISDTAASSERIALLAAGARAGDPVSAQSISAGGGSDIADSSTSYSANTWHHAVGVFTASNVIAYNNGGGKVSVANTTSLTSLDTTNIGARYSGSGLGAFLSGAVAEAAIWNIALTDAEALILARGYSPLFVCPANLFAYWPLTGRASAEHDPIGKFDMTVTGATQAAHPRIIYPSSRVVIPVATAVVVPPAGTNHHFLPLLGAA